MAVTLEGLPRTIAVTVIPGGAAGTHILRGGHLDASGATLLSVRHVSANFVTNADLTSEFTITGYNTIANGGGTSSANNFLVVTYARPATT